MSNFVKTKVAQTKVSEHAEAIHPETVGEN